MRVYVIKMKKVGSINIVVYTIGRYPRLVPEASMEKRREKRCCRRM
jgi:hypothetical protein